MIFPLMSHVSYPKHPASAAQLPSISQHEVLYLGTVELLICGSCAVTAAAMYQRNSYQMLGAGEVRWMSFLESSWIHPVSPTGKNYMKNNNIGKWRRFYWKLKYGFHNFSHFFRISKSKDGTPWECAGEAICEGRHQRDAAWDFCCVGLDMFWWTGFHTNKKTSKGVVRTMAVLPPEPSFWILI